MEFSFLIKRTDTNSREVSRNRIPSGIPAISHPSFEQSLVGEGDVDCALGQFSPSFSTVSPRCLRGFDHIPHHVLWRIFNVSGWSDRWEMDQGRESQVESAQLEDASLACCQEYGEIFEIMTLLHKYHFTRILLTSTAEIRITVLLLCSFLCGPINMIPRTVLFNGL